jgi:hypothetical protein
MNEPTSDPVLENLDREEIVLRLGTILRKLNVLTERQVGLDPVSEAEARERFRSLAHSWQVLMHELACLDDSPAIAETQPL